MLRETYGSNVLDFFYDQNGYPYALKYNGTMYYYITNLQGDVMYLVDSSGATVAAYEYDPFGNIVSQDGSMATINPLRYRGYYYDADLDMYYLQSRYYDPNIGRFISADDVHYIGADGTVSSYNLFTYCKNSPFLYTDESGHWAESYSGFKLTSVGFNVNYSSSFMSKLFCLSYASNVISMYGGWSWLYGRSYKKMTSERIAKELFAHAVLYNIGIGAIGTGTLTMIVDALIQKAAGRHVLKKLSTLAAKIAYLEVKLGIYLFDHSRLINVNNNETIGRLFVFNVIWIVL